MAPISPAKTTTGWQLPPMQAPPRQSCPHAPQLAGSTLGSAPQPAEPAESLIDEPMLEGGHPIEALPVEALATDALLLVAPPAPTSSGLRAPQPPRVRAAQKPSASTAAALRS